MVQLLGKDVGTTGYGLMGLTWRPNPQPVEDSIKAMKAALDAGCNFWNGGEFYGTPEYNSLHLLEKYFTKYPEDADKVVLSIKGGLNTKTMSPDGSPEGVRRSVDNILKLLNGKKKLDIFECARVDKNTPIETTMKVLEEEYVKTGKLGGISLSEVGPVTIQKAAKATKIVAVEVEVSLTAIDVFQNGVAKACAENDILMVAYSPLGRGLLTGDIKKPEDLPEGDYRRHLPRFSKENFDNNVKLVNEVNKLAKEKGCTGAQIAVNWVKHMSKKDGNPEIIPIPGATTVERILENVKEVSLSADDMEALDSILKQFPILGDRYDANTMKHSEV
ncbi:aldo keto reductase protein [Rutstroemia sp. NJR-2017a WRK4]|nr:aldo keto reductase protein [Rutstroemia sp. NJR-2017a WRK4]PQE14901.1 aldo keto reductase protein [Rutstroemia sp. NJR-2017a WRK4]